MIHDHSYLTSDDHCYYLLDYTSNEGFSYSDSNSLLLNCKKKMDKRGTSEWVYKERAILKLSRMIRNKLSSENLKKVSIVPIPPSKAKNDPMYDNRLFKILNYAYGDNADIIDCLEQKKSRIESHLRDPRPSIQDHMNGYLVNKDLMNNLRNIVILFDDILTSGSQYIACKNTILKYRKDVKIVGLFLARRVPKN